MSDHGPAVDPSQVLSERKLEELRLLAGEHTIMTIATELGRSESSSHERLRAARRKSGAGSSRELARLLGSQEIWERKVVLPPMVEAFDSNEAPDASGRIRPKEHAPMLLVVALTGIGLIFAAQPVVQQTINDGPSQPLPLPPRPSPGAGRWTPLTSLPTSGLGRRRFSSVKRRMAVGQVPLRLSQPMELAEKAGQRQ